MSHRISQELRRNVALSVGKRPVTAAPGAPAHVSAPTRVRWLSALPFLLAALGVPAIELAASATTSIPGLIASFNDDAYYYFEIASNLAAGRGSSFDGVAPTNGYHPLWLLLLTPLFLFTGDQHQALLAVKALSSASWMLSILLLYLLARRLGRVPEMSIALVAPVLSRSLWFSGMESTIVVPILLVAILLALQNSAFDAGSRAGLWKLGLGLMLVPLARLDAAFFVAAVCALLLLWRTGTPRRRAVDAAIAAIPTAVAIGGYVLLNQAIFGSAIPVSGRAKTLDGGGAGWSVYASYFEGKTVGLWVFDHIPVGWLWGACVATALALLAWLRTRSPVPGRVKGSQGLASLEPILWALVLAKLGQLTYYALASTWPLGRWYHYYLPILLALALTVLVGVALDLLAIRRFATPALAAAVCVLLGIHLVKSHLWRQGVSVSLDQSYMTQSVAVAQHLHRVTPPDSVFAMGDRAGSLAYQLDRRLIQTEGLVGSAAFLEALSRGEVHRYLTDQGVDYVLYSGGERESSELRPVAGRPGCFSFTEPKFGRGPLFSIVVCDADRIYYRELSSDGSMGGMYGVWRYRPEIQDQLPEERTGS